MIQKLGSVQTLRTMADSARSTGQGALADQLDAVANDIEHEVNSIIMQLLQDKDTFGKED